MAIYCNKCGTRHECSVCPVCAGFGLSNLQAPAGVGKSFQQSDELRAKFEALIAEWRNRESENSRYSHEYYSGKSSAYGSCADELEEALQAAHTSRDAEVEALRKDVARLNWLEQDMKAGSDGTSIYYCLGKFCYPYLSSSGVGEKSENTLREAIDAAMQEDRK